jgi:hypothetical protein
MSLTQQQIINLIKTYINSAKINSVQLTSTSLILAWGSITGNINSQTDLQTLLANKISFDDLYYDSELKALIYLDGES